MELNELPMTVGHWKRRSSASAAYLSTEHNGLAAIVDLKGNSVTFGTYIPCGAELKRVPVEGTGELIKVLTEFKQENVRNE